jgi:hypothetical protein
MSESANAPNKNVISKPQQPPSTTQQPSTAATATATTMSYEERLTRSLRTMETAAIQMLSKAEKSMAAQEQAQQQQQHQQRHQSQDAAVASSEQQQAARESLKQLDESVVAFLKTRIEFLRLLSHIEAKLQGKAAEMEALETYIKTEPRVGSSKTKRKHSEIETGGLTDDETRLSTT